MIFLDCLTRNTPNATKLPEKHQKIYNALATASLSQNSAGVDTSRSAWLTPAALKQFMLTHQMEVIEDDDATRIIRVHEPDPVMRAKNRLSFEGFARFLLDRTNYAFLNEEAKMKDGVRNLL